MGRKSHLPDTYVYPAIIEDSGKHCIVKFPDFPNCYADGKDYIDSFNKSRDVLGLHIHMAEVKKEEIPKPTSIDKVGVSKKQIVCLIEIDMKLIRAKLKGKSVKQTVIIPEYLKLLGEQEGIDLSEILKEALIEKLNVK